MFFLIPRYPASFQNVRGRAASNCRRRQRRTHLTYHQRYQKVLRAAQAPETEDNENVVLYEDDGSRVIPVPLFVTATQEQVITGVYGILDEYRELVYVGMSRDVAASLVSHSENHVDDVFYVKVMTFQVPAIPEMKRVVESWILDNEVTPKGNVEAWHEIDTDLTEQANSTVIDVSSSQELRISPFANDPYATAEPREIMSLTAANVDLVLDEVRPYLIADGGNVSVQNVNCDTGKIELLLEGACNACASATTTMQLGIEKALREKFGKNLGEVVAVNTTDADNETSLEACENALDTIRDTLRGLGGEISIVELDEDEVVVSFSGPSNLRYGIEQTLIRKVPEIEVVTFE